MVEDCVVRHQTKRSMCRLVETDSRGRMQGKRRGYLCTDLVLDVLTVAFEFLAVRDDLASVPLSQLHFSLPNMYSITETVPRLALLSFCSVLPPATDAFHSQCMHLNMSRPSCARKCMWSTAFNSMTYGICSSWRHDCFSFRCRFFPALHFV